MATHITKKDLHIFKQELLESLTEILSNHYHPSKRWIKSTEVRKLLRISGSTLQNFRKNGILPYTKVGGIIYYSYEDILKLMETSRKSAE